MPKLRPATSTALAVRTRWTPDEARALLAEWTRSGLSARAFGQPRGVDPKRLYRWRERLSLTPEVALAFEEVRVGGGDRVVEVHPGDAGLDLVAPSGHMVRLKTAFDAAALDRLLDVLDRRGVRC